MPAASAAAERLAAHWVADALAADETIDFSVIKALVGVSSEYLVGAPDATRERVALRCLQELATYAVAEEDGEAAAAAEQSGMLRVDAARSCEEVLVELTGKVGSSRSFDKDKILPFRQDIQNFISIKKPTLPETSLELLREVDPEIQSVASPSPVDQNGIKKHENNKPLCNANHLYSNAEEPRLPLVSAELQPENLTNVVIVTEIGNFQRCPIEPTVDLDRPCASDSMIYNQPQEDAVNAASFGARSPEKNLSNVDSISDIAVSAGPASASCNTTLQENIEAPLSERDAVDKTTVVQSQHCKGDSQNPNDDGTSDQSLKDPSHERQSVQVTIAPAFDGSNVVLPTNASEANHLVNQDLDGSASTPHIEKDPIHEELTLQAASKPSVTCKDAMQEDNSGTNHPSCNTTEHTRMFEEEIGDKSQLESSCANKNNHTLYDDATMLEKNKKNSNQPHDAEKDHQVENTEARDTAGNGHSPHERGNSSQNRCSPAADPEVEADKDDAPTNSHRPEDSSEIEASSSNDSGKRSLDIMICVIQEAMEKFTPRDNGDIPWVHILEYGRNVFHRTRLPCDLRVKWRNMKKKEGF
nr:unnamed protein product [Digitaria exilis]